MGTSETGREKHLAARATELTQLSRVFQEIRGGKGGRGRLVMLTGAGGVGKTALAQVFLKQVKAMDHLALALGAQCVEDQTAHRPYAPFRDLLAQVRAAGGEAGLSTIVGKEAPGWLPNARQSAGRNALFDQFLALCRAITRQRALVLFIDDLQWSDRSSLDLLGRLVSALASLPILVLATYEETASENAVSIKGVLSRVGPNSIELIIRELEKDAILELAEDLLDGAFSSELGDWLVNAARGNPLRAEQLLRWLVERRIVRKRLFRYSVREKELPSLTEDIESVIVSRLDGLEPNLRWTLEAAALAGSVIDSAVVTGQVGKSEEEVLALLRTAEEAHGLIDGVGDRRWANGRWSVRFHFRHPLIRRLLRGRVAEKRLNHLSSRAAEMLQQLAGDGAAEIAGEIAALYLGTDMTERVRLWSLKAADLAERLYAVYELEDFLRVAARTAGDEQDRLRIENRLARLYAATEREPEAEALGEAVHKRARELGETEVEVSSGTMLGWLLLERGVPPLKLSELAGQLVDTARGAEKPEGLVMALDLSCVVAERIGRAEEALLMAEEALHVAGQSGDAEIVAQAAYRLARVHVSWDSPEQGRELAQRALDVFAQMDELSGVAVCHDLLGLANFRAGDWDGALHHWESALETMEVAGIPDEKIAMQFNIAELLTLRGEFDRALDLFTSGLRLAQELDDQRLARRCRTGIARLEFERGDYARVLEQTEEIRKTLPESGAWRDDFQTTAVRALAYLELGDELQAWQEAARLEQLYQGKEGWFERRAEGDAVRIRVIDLDSDAWLAGTVADQGIGETADKDPYGEGFLQYHRACVLARARPAEARQAVERAVELFTKLGAAPMLRRAQQFRDALPMVEALADEPESEPTGIDEDQVDKWFDSFEG
ncbi:MAG: AAA family ATPase [Gemmatimonadota bacterium]